MISIAVLAWSGFGATIMGLMYFSAGNNSTAGMWLFIAIGLLAAATLLAMVRRRRL